MTKLALTGACIAALALSGSALAQDFDEDDDGATRLPSLLVAAGITPVEQEKSGRAFTVITGEELARSQTRYVADALRLVPGFHVSRGGAPGGLTQVRVRGAEANHVLVLVDGVEVSAVGQGEFDFGGLLVGDVERIEILRGPQSAFWGSNATAGVINIVTRRGPTDGVEIDSRAETGTDGTVMGGLALRGGNERIDAAFSAQYRRTDGFNLSDFGSEKDGSENLTLSGRFNLQLTDNLVIDGSGRFVDRLSETDTQDFAYPPTPTQGLVIDSDDEMGMLEFSGTLGATWTSPDGAWTHVARLSGNGDKREDFAGGVRIAGNTGTRLKAETRSTYRFDTPAIADAVHRISAGYQWERERFRQLAPVFDPSQLATKERAAHSLIAEYRGEFADQFYLNGAARHDVNEAFADSTTYSLSAAWAIPDTGTRLHGSLGTGVTNPTFFEQFGFIPSQFAGNPGLLPEKSFGWDIGVEQTFLDGDLIVDVTYFNQDLTNEIATVYPPPTYIATPVNLDGISHRQGVEVAATARLFHGFSATATYTYTDSRDADGVREVRRPLHSASLSAAYRFWDDRADLFGEIVYNGEMEDNEFIDATPQNRVRLDEYVLVTVGGSVEITDNLSAFGRIENLFDAEYEEVFGYNTQGRTAFVGIKGRF